MKTHLVKDVYTYMSWLEQEVIEKSHESLSCDQARRVWGIPDVYELITDFELLSAP